VSGNKNKFSHVTAVANLMFNKDYRILVKFRTLKGHIAQKLLKDF